MTDTKPVQTIVEVVDQIDNNDQIDYKKRVTIGLAIGLAMISWFIPVPQDNPLSSSRSHGEQNPSPPLSTEVAVNTPSLTSIDP